MTQIVFVILLVAFCCRDRQPRGGVRCKWYVHAGDHLTTDSTPSRDRIDLEAVATHEFGHGIGLRHINALGVVLLLLCLPSTACADIDDLNAVNLRRIQNGYEQLKPHPALMAQAEASSNHQATNGYGHCMKMLNGTWEGVGYQSGDDPFGLGFHSCYHFPKQVGAPPTTRRAYWAGVAAVSNGRNTYYTIVWAPKGWSGAENTEVQPQVKKKTGRGRRSSGRKFRIFRRR